MLLKELLDGLAYDADGMERLASLDVRSLCSDSRKAVPGSLFVALSGPSEDGARFLKDAVEHGAQIAVVNHKSTVSFEKGCTGLLRVKDTKPFLAELCRRFYGNPAEKLDVIGVTGTNGKTTVTYLLECIATRQKKNCGVIGTVNHRFEGKTIHAGNTTPGIIDNFSLLHDMARAGAQYCFMEVSSHALDQGRVCGIDFKGAIFTNLTQDHLDYHASQEEYFQAKKKLFDNLRAGACSVINCDDLYGQKLIALHGANTITYGIKNKADVTARDIRLDLSGSAFTVSCGKKAIGIKAPLIGMHNVYNILAASAFCLSAGFSLEHIKEGIHRLERVPGRMELVSPGQDIFIYVDYAHTDDALSNVLTSLKEISRKRLLVIFGCGGNRDRGKRCKMGEVACRLADFSILTNDNPRNEDALDIIREIETGFSKDNYTSIPDRREAIREGIKLARPGDILLVAGKGHEDYQIIGSETFPFDDRQVIRDTLAACFKSEKSKK